MSDDDPGTKADALPGAAHGPPQRLDKWLWFARIVKSRSLAQKLVGGGHVRVNRDKTTAPAKLVRAGDVLTIVVADHVRLLKVRAPGVRRGPAPEAQQLYEDLQPRPDPSAEPDPQGVAAPAGSTGAMIGADLPAPARREPGSGRPTKRERRELDRLRGDE
ncbi:RNA-binding S4 domain-containing protein [Stappia sp.]|uniref:RNA-binding S4 domain-containing protein n=1 Tax=Stappia sp. TaxID=1870903 RepID=UPI003D0B467F